MDLNLNRLSNGGNIKGENNKIGTFVNEFFFATQTIRNSSIRSLTNCSKRAALIIFNNAPGSLRPPPSAIIMIIIDAAIAPIDRKYTFPIIRVIHIRAINYRSLIRCNEPSLLVPRLDYNSGRVFDHLVAGRERERERGNASGVACPEISGLVFIILDLSVFLPLFSRNFAFTIESNEQEGLDNYFDWNK